MPVSTSALPPTYRLTTRKNQAHKFARAARILPASSTKVRTCVKRLFTNPGPARRAGVPILLFAGRRVWYAELAASQCPSYFSVISARCRASF